MLGALLILLVIKNREVLVQALLVLPQVKDPLHGGTGRGFPAFSVFLPYSPALLRKNRPVVLRKCSKRSENSKHPGCVFVGDCTFMGFRQLASFSSPFFSLKNPLSF